MTGWYAFRFGRPAFKNDRECRGTILCQEACEGNEVSVVRAVHTDDVVIRSERDRMARAGCRSCSTSGCN